MVYAPFKASIIPWRVRAPLYREMVEKEEYAREQRIKRNADISLSLAKLPPRMQEYAESKKQEVEEKARSQSVDLMFTFQPPRAKQVPDFKRLQKQFQQNLEDVKRQKAQSTTVPEPFHFHNPKSTAGMRRYLDSENQMINPTLLKPAQRARSAASIGTAVLRQGYSPVAGERNEKENPANTAKFSAYVIKRR